MFLNIIILLQRGIYINNYVTPIKYNKDQNNYSQIHINCIITH